MEGTLWLLFAAYIVVGCFYYVASINRIVSFIIKMNGMSIVNFVATCILLMALIMAWPYLLWLDIKDQMEQPYEYDVDD
jgi:hypothetical protein